MTIAFLNPGGEIGGAEQVLIDVLRSLRTARPDWNLHVVTGSAGPLLTRLSALGVQVHVVPMPVGIARLGDARADRTLAGRLAFSALFLPAYVGRLRRVLKEIRPDLVQTNGFKMHLLGCWAAVRKTPVVWHVHDFVSSRPVMAPLLRLHARHCAAACAVSDGVMRDLRKVCGEGFRIRSVHNGIDLDEFSPSGPVAKLDDFGGMPPPPERTVRVGLVATMARWKGHRVFLRAIARLPRELPFRAYVIGGPIYRTRGSEETIAALRALTEELGISDRVVFTGYRADSAAIMRALDVVVHASTEPEPFGLVIAQALACGRAVVATRTAGAADRIRFGEAALDHCSGDHAALSRNIQLLIEDAERRQTLGERAREAACLWFDRQRMAAEMIRAYGEIVSPRVESARAVSDLGEVRS